MAASSPNPHVVLGILGYFQEKGRTSLFVDAKRSQNNAYTLTLGYATPTSMHSQVTLGPYSLNGKQLEESVLEAFSSPLTAPHKGVSVHLLCDSTQIACYASQERHSPK